MSADRAVKKMLAGFYDYRATISLHKKARQINTCIKAAGESASPPAGVADEYRRRWSPFGGDSRLLWLRMYGSVSGVWDPRYVPETAYYTRIEPCLNNKTMSKGFSDKNIYSVWLKGFSLPVTVLSNIEGSWYDAGLNPLSPARAGEIMASHKKLVVKPALDSGGGKGVALTGTDYPPLETPGRVVKSYRKNFIMQEVIEGHPFYSQFSATSVNTLRVLTFRSFTDETIIPLHTLLRVGRVGSITDNQASGGYACGVDRHGALTGSAVDKWGRVFSEVNGNPLIPGTPLTGYDEMLSVALDAASGFPYARLLGLDLCYDSDEKVRLIEVNNLNNEINFYQMLYGPLFSDLTDEILQWCHGRARSFLIDYEI